MTETASQSPPRALSPGQHGFLVCRVRGQLGGPPGWSLGAEGAAGPGDGSGLLPVRNRKCQVLPPFPRGPDSWRQPCSPTPLSRPPSCAPPASFHSPGSGPGWPLAAGADKRGQLTALSPLGLWVWPEHLVHSFRVFVQNTGHKVPQQCFPCTPGDAAFQVDGT